MFYWLVCLSLCFVSQALTLSYTHLTDGMFSSIHILVVDPHEEHIVPVKANQRETVKTLASMHGANAAVNGGFWKDNGDPAGILKIAGKWYGIPHKPRGAIGWKEDGRSVIIDRVLTDRNDVTDLPIEVIPVSSPPKTTPLEWDAMEHVVGGTPVLISKGEMVTDIEAEQTILSFLYKRHPRTAVGIRESGEWVFVVVDGRIQGQFGGMTIPELAEAMFHLKCTDALNLDGGGSSTMVIDGTVVNEPVGYLCEDDKHVTPVSDAILIY